MAERPDLIILSFEHELNDLVGLCATRECNLNARNYEWVVVKAFEVLKENVDQDYLQAEFVVTVIDTLMPHVKLMGDERTGEMSEFNFISQALLKTVQGLHKRLVYEQLFYQDRFPYVPYKFVTSTDIVFERKSDGLPFILKNKM